MKIALTQLKISDRHSTIHKLVKEDGLRIGLITSIDGSQLLTLLIDPKNGDFHLFETSLDSQHYPSMSKCLPSVHWQERIVWNMFGLVPDHHPRLKQVLLHEPYGADFFPLRADDVPFEVSERPHQGQYQFLEVQGEGVYEIPVGPIHAGIIEPGHFRFSCLGEVILNLEIRLGYVHRGVEKRLTEAPLHKGRFIAESAASDSSAAYALGFAECIESMFSVEVPLRARLLRVLALELERVGMHFADLGGLAGDIGFLAAASSFQRIRGTAFRMAELLTGQRFLRAFICPFGVVRDVSAASLQEINACLAELKKEAPVLAEMLLENQGVNDRMRGVGRVTHSLAEEFALVGPSGRACGINYDARQFHQDYPNFELVVQAEGDVYSRALIRALEIQKSIAIMECALDKLGSQTSPFCLQAPAQLPANAIGCSAVEGHRGELIHLALTDPSGKIKRYCIKDASVNNWTALAIAARNNLVADFPLCNKSFSLAYSGHDV